TRPCAPSSSTAAARKTWPSASATTTLPSASSWASSGPPAPAGSRPPFRRPAAGSAARPPGRGRPPAPTPGHRPPPRPHPHPRAAPARGALSLPPGRRLRPGVAAIFLSLPLLAQLRFEALPRQAGYPGSRMVPAPAALLSLLALKLLDKERRSHIDDFNCDEALGLFCGLNVLPKKSYATAYSYRTGRANQRALLAGCAGPLPGLLF